MEAKSRPSHVPDERPSLAESLALAIEDPEAARDFRITLEVGGGIEGQSYGFHFEASGGGEMRCRMECEPSGRKGHGERKSLDHATYARLLRRIRSSGILQIPQEGPPFLPDTVVGCLQITNGRTVRKDYFAADSDQAQVQNRKPPAQLLRAVEAVYEEGARLMRVRSVKP